MDTKQHHLVTTKENCQIVGKRFSVGEALCLSDDTRMRMHFIWYCKVISHNWLSSPRLLLQLSFTVWFEFTSPNVIPKRNWYAARFRCLQSFCWELVCISCGYLCCTIVDMCQTGTLIKVYLVCIPCGYLCCTYRYTRVILDLMYHPV